MSRNLAQNSGVVIDVEDKVHFDFHRMSIWAEEKVNIEALETRHFFEVCIKKQIEAHSSVGRALG